jgi:hypothetical protein
MSLSQRSPGQTRAIVGLLCAFLTAVAAGAPLGSRVAVESRLPIYRNADEALLVFVRGDVADEFALRLSFEEQTTGHVPATPLSLTLSGPRQRHEVPVDIRDWPDGEYRVLIADPAEPEQTLVRAIRKETLVPPAPPNGPVDVDGDTIFLVDDWYLDRVRGLERVGRPAEQLPVEPWQKDPAYRFIRTSIREFRVGIDDAFYVRLLGENALGGADASYWARSRDLRDWEVVEQPAPPHPAGIPENLSQAPERRAGSPRYRRYDAATDGPVDLAQVRVRWSGLGRNVRWGDVRIPYRSRIAVWEKPNGEHLILGDPITRDKHEFAPGEIGRWSDSNDNFGEARLSADGTTLRCYQTRLIPRHDPFRVHYDNILAERIMVIWSTADGLTWTPSTFDAPTLEDPWSTQHYGVDIWEEEGGRLQLAYHRIYDVQTQRVFTTLACSRDGLYWHRFTDGGPFLGNGPRGSFNFGYAITTGNRTRLRWRDHCYEPIQGINVLHFMFIQVNRRVNRSGVTADFFRSRFGGRLAGPHGVENSPIMAWFDSWDDIAEASRRQVFTPGFMRYRTDRWVAAQPRERRADFTTKPLIASGALRINAETEADGYVRVEILDRHGNPFPAYCAGNAAVFRGDETSAALSWSDGAVTSLPPPPFTISISLEKAALYTLQF